MQNLIVITGQTATGKTRFACRLAQKYNGELINCDSRQIYKKLDIITGKDIPPKSKFHLINQLNKFDIGYYQVELSNRQTAKNSLTIKKFNNLKIWLYDVIDPSQPSSSYDWVQCAKYVVNDIVKRGKTPIIVGGTYLYLKHLLYGVETENIPPDWRFRKQVEKKSVPELQHILKNLSLQLINKLKRSDLNNPRRLIRQIEIARYRRRRDAVYNTSNKRTPALINRYAVDIIGLKYANKPPLISAIQKRVEQRIKQGAVAELRQLLKRGYNLTDPGLKTIGCLSINYCLQGKIDQQETIKHWVIKETQYAKRQYTFMKKDPHIRWRIV